MKKWVKQNAALLLWLVIPVCAGLLYPFARSDRQLLEWLSIGLLLYAIFFSVVAHELSHGLAASWCGDPTARNAGRLTLNPLSHISLIGTILVPLALAAAHVGVVFGWAKPVPFQPAHFKEYPRDQVMVAVAGPLANFTLAYLCANAYLLLGLGFQRLFPESVLRFTLDPFAPLSFHNAAYEGVWFVLFKILGVGVIVNTVLGVFNLIPIPPLDGSWILKAFLPRTLLPLFGKFRVAGLILLILALKLNWLDLFFYPAFLLLGGFQFLINVCLG